MMKICSAICLLTILNLDVNDGAAILYIILQKMIETPMWCNMFWCTIFSKNG